VAAHPGAYLPALAAHPGQPRCWPCQPKLKIKVRRILATSFPKFNGTMKVTLIIITLFYTKSFMMIPETVFP